MNKMEFPASESILESRSSNYLFKWSDLKEIMKIGIINSNTMTAFAGFWLALYYTGASFYLNWHVLLVCVIGTAFVIAGGCVINNYYDRDIDQKMLRTKTRPTVTGSIDLQHVLVIGIGFTIAGLLILSLASIQTAMIGFAGWFSYVVLYTIWSKRRYTINTAIGSLSGAIPPLIGWSAIDQNLHPVAWVLFLLIFIWQTPHFLAIAMKKVEDYRIANIPMLPVIHGFAITKRQMVIYVTCLIPIPFFLYGLGYSFVIIASLLNIGWLLLAVRGLSSKTDDIKWANQMFIYSLVYLTVIFFAMIIISLFSIIL
ncbi:protoheme IX farnesyltransferase [Gracilibacillus ureilyticus]|uniref:Protoheme IX farnesyltransferase n=1 Tax=Gracilibacillus ureilyticus TaxID=531814 RepID=A0A1H9TJB2_9BACI|nr:heme o synthase [Gracilibacillus ureilyticus]SER97137.1 protoheme IX farnesyltransferase [Gracilibacillus ureilyticus]